MNIILKGKIDKFWKYRSAHIVFDDVRVKIDITDMNVVKKYIEANGYQCDNHICWKVGETYFMFSDWVLTIGDKIVEENW